MPGYRLRRLATGLLATALVAGLSPLPAPAAATTIREALPLAVEGLQAVGRTIGGAIAAASPPTGLFEPAVAPAIASAVAPAIASAIVPGTVNRSSLAVEATYDVDVRLSAAARTLRGSVTIEAVNRSGGGIDRLELNTVMARLGGMRLGTVSVDGAPVAATIDDQTVIVPLGGVLPDGAAVTVSVSFSATLRASLTGSNWLFTRVNGVVDLYRWIPWISRRTPFARPNHGDPFVTPVSPRVTVRLHTDAPMVVATSGEQTSVSTDRLTRTFVATDVRDFTVAAARDYRVSRATVGDNQVWVYTRPGGPASALMTAAKAALSKLEARLGPYPYKVLRIVQSAGGYGMEGPGVAWIPTGVGTSNLTYLVTHEVAHQWFYGIVGNDQAREPFADEAAADFVTRYVLGMRRAPRCTATTLDRSIYRYTSACYYETIYIQGGNLLESTRRKIGATAFWRAIRGYLADNRWGLVHTRTLLDALDDATPANLAAWWGYRFPSLY